MSSGQGDERQASAATTTTATATARRVPRPLGDDLASRRRRQRARRAGRRSHRHRLRARTSAISTGAPTIAATTPASSSAGATTTRPTTSAASSTIGAERPPRGQHPPVVGADQRAGDVRHHQADEGDRADQRGRAAAEQDHGEAGTTRPRRRSAPRPAGEVVAERHRVEEAGRASSASTSPDDDERREHAWPCRGPGRPGTPPTRSGTARAPAVAEQDQRDQRGGAAVKAAPTSASFTGVAPSPPVDRRVDHDGGDRGADEREPDEAGRAGDTEEGDRDDDGQRRAGVDAEQPRVGDRVAGDPCISAPATPSAAPPRGRRRCAAAAGRARRVVGVARDAVNAWTTTSQRDLPGCRWRGSRRRRARAGRTRSPRVAASGTRRRRGRAGAPGGGGTVAVARGIRSAIPVQSSSARPVRQ